MLIRSRVGKLSKQGLLIFGLVFAVVGIVAIKPLLAEPNPIPTPSYPSPLISYEYNKSSFYGVNVPGDTIPDFRGTTNDGLASGLRNKLSSSGVKWLRSDVGKTLYWANYQNTNCLSGLCDTSKFPGDKFSILASIDHVTMRDAPWFCSTSYAPGQEGSFSLAQWNQVVDCVSKKFKGKIKVYEIWNEPIAAVFKLGYQDGSPEHYFQMLQSAYKIIKANDPAATVIGLGGAFIYTGGDYTLLETNKSFAARLASLGAASFMDGISLHPYPWGTPNKDTWSKMEANWDYYASLFPNKPVWVTETGHRATETGSQSYYLYYAYSLMINKGAKRIFWYSLIDDPFDPFFGMYDKTGKARPILGYHKQYTTVAKSGLLRIETIPAAQVKFTITPATNSSSYSPLTAEWGVNWERLQNGKYQIAFSYPSSTFNDQTVKLPPTQNIVVKAGMTLELKVDITKGSISTTYFWE